MENNNTETRFSEYVGISSPETPKYLILINYLSRYFRYDKGFVARYEEIIKWQNDSNIITEESDLNAKEQLRQSFQAYFEAYSGYDALKKSSRTKKRFFPLTPDMLTPSAFNLRHLLFALQFASIKSKDKEIQEYKTTQKQLYDFLYDHSNRADIHRIIQHICGMPKSFEDEISNNRLEIKFGEQEKQRYFDKLSKKFNTQLHKVLTDRNLLHTDFYTRMEFLCTFCSLYVLEFLLARTNNTFEQVYDESKRNLIVCKGSVNWDSGNDAFHKASQSNYVNIRSRFSEIMKQYYLRQFGRIESPKIKLILQDSGKIQVYYKTKADSNEKPRDLSHFLSENNLAISTRKNTSDQLSKFRERFFSDGSSEKNYTKDDFAMEFYNLQKKTQGSSVAKLVSTLPTTARDMNFLFPQNNARQKYFAMSGDIAEFFVRLYLICNEQNFGYFDDFIHWLENEYLIYVRLDDKNILRKYLRNINAVVSEKDSNRNEAAFVQTLLEANCLIKLSDSGYLVVTPEKKEGVFLL